jgi:ATP-binding cassette subfamily F protein 2
MPPSKSKEARLAKQAAKKKPSSNLVSEANSGAPSKASSLNGDDGTTGDTMIDADEVAIDEKVARLKLQEDAHGISDRVTTGVLASLEASRDVKITSTSLVFHGRVLITDSTLEVNYGRRYGLLGENGCGKSTLLKAIDKREFPFPEHLDIYLLNEGAPPSELGALEWVVKEAEKEVDRLEKLAEDLSEREGPDSNVVMDIYDVSTRIDAAASQSELTYYSVSTAWTQPHSKHAPPSFSPVSVSTRSQSTRKQRTCLVVGVCVSLLARHSLSSQRSCSSTTQPHI